MRGEERTRPFRVSLLRRFTFLPPALLTLGAEKPRLESAEKLLAGTKRVLVDMV